MDLRCANPKDVKHYTTERLREEFHISGLFTRIIQKWYIAILTVLSQQDLCL